MSEYRKTLQQIRQFFPQPVSDRVHDAYFVFSIARALDIVDGLKSSIPLLGQPRPIDFSAAAGARMPEGVSNIEDVTGRLVRKLEGLPNWAHPRNQVNVIAPPSIPSIIGNLLPTIYNPNLVSEDSSVNILVAENEVAAMAADLVGFDPAVSGGVFTFGGTGTNLYGVRVGLEKAMPGTMADGIHGKAVILASQQGHYSKRTVAAWLGLGERAVVEVPSHPANDVRLDLLEAAARRVIAEGQKIACIVATMGTTDAFGIDDLEGIVAMRDRLVEECKLDYRPHVHADAVIGWAWSVFNDYDFSENPLGFRPRTVRALAGVQRRMSKLRLADSLGIDFHKTGFCPYISSLFLVRDRSDLRLIARRKETMPYLFQTGEHHPGVYTLETTRSGSGVMAALGNLLLLGRAGLRTLLGHLVEMAEVLREHLEGHSTTTVLNGDNLGMVTLFRVYPDGVDTWSVKDRERTDASYQEELRKHNDYNRRVFRYLYDEAMRAEGVLISLTECYRMSDHGEPINALKSFCLSPFLDVEHVELLVSKVLEAREHV